MYNTLSEELERAWGGLTEGDAYIHSVLEIHNEAAFQSGVVAVNFSVVVQISSFLQNCTLLRAGVVHHRRGIPQLP